MEKAERYINNLIRIGSIVEAEKYNERVFLLPDNIEFSLKEGDLVKTKGLGEKWDSRELDLIYPIKLEDALNLKFEYTNVLTPLAYAESCSDKPWHITTQSILFSKVTTESIEWIKEENSKNKYGRHEFDNFWLSFSKSLKELAEGETVAIFNRRVNGWDGSYDRPVIELLGAGGHLPVVWDDDINSYKPLSFEDNLIKEVKEELNLDIVKSDIVIFGGFSNVVTHELVVLCGVKIDDKLLPDIQSYAEKNIDIDTEGIYIGTFNEVIQYYRENPTPFAGGEKSAPYNFPNNLKLMNRAIEYMKKF